MADLAVAGGTMPPWADLPPDIIGIILGTLPDLEDIGRFSCVCTAWHSAAAARRGAALSRFPLLLHPGRRFFSVAGSRSYPLPPHAVDAARDRYLFASPGGKLLAVGDDWSVIFIDPFGGISVHLPDYPFLTDSVGSDDFAWDVSPHGVLAQYHGSEYRLFFWRTGSTRWTLIDSSLSNEGWWSITYRNGNFVLFSIKDYTTRVYDALSLTVSLVLRPPDRFSVDDYMWCAVAAEGELLLVSGIWLRGSNNRDVVMVVGRWIPDR